MRCRLNDRIYRACNIADNFKNQDQEGSGGKTP